MTEYIHIGKEIAMILNSRHMTKRELGADIGMSASNAVYLTTRESIDVRTLHKISNVLEYNFFKHFPVDEGTGVVVDAKIGEKDKLIEELKGKIAGQEKVIDNMKRELEIVKIENGYLKEINALLKK